ncbi:SAM-dependent tRNA/rRNA cytosine-C5 methylase, partial [Candidatus Bathyarchaeota archaeon]
GWFNRRTIKDVERHVRLQRKIITEALQTLSDDGEIVYSTCSLEPEENEFNIDWAVKDLDAEVVPVDCFGEKASTNIFGVELDDAIADCRRIWPGNTQGFFVCKLRKRS